MFDIIIFRLSHSCCMASLSLQLVHLKEDWHSLLHVNVQLQLAALDEKMRSRPMLC